MKTIVNIIFTIFFASGLCASAFAIHETMPSETQITLPGPNAAELYRYITTLNPYARWQLWPGKGKIYKGTEPHGSLLTTYVNDTAYRSAGEKTAMTDGAIIVKENYTAEKKLAALTVMHKIKGYNPEAGDWFWAKYTPEGKVEASGRVKVCIDCHTAKKDNDFIYTGEVKKK